jgi:ribonuclease G
MAKEILVNFDPKEKRIAIVQDGKLDEFFIERPQEKTIVGNIYKGSIEAVIPSIAGAFVDIGLPKKGFLYLSEIESYFDTLDSHEFGSPKSENGGKHNSHKGSKKDFLNNIKKGQEILVQVVKEPFGTKGPRLTCHIGIPGRDLVLMPQEHQIGVSRRIDDDDERRRLRQIIAEFKMPKDVGFIVRTVARGKSKQELWRDANFLIKLWRRIEKISKGRKAPVLVYEEYDVSLRIVRDSFSEDVDKLLVDSKAEFYRIQRFIRTFMRDLTRKIEFYSGEDLFTDKGIEKQINRVFESKIYLKSKSYIIIEPTEGLVVIDVNSGGFKKNLEQEEAAFKINCEAAIEAAHQLKLRDLGGIIVIDFIDMMQESHRREVFNVLKHALSLDKAKYDILSISKFGLVEMTRERIHNTVQSISNTACPYCQGKGKVRSPVTISITAVKELKKYLKDKTLSEVNLNVNPLVAEEVSKDKETLKFIERRFRTKVNVIPNPTLHIETFSFS